MTVRRFFLAAVALVLAAGPAPALTIDNFEEGSFFQGGSGSAEQSGLSTANVLGGSRLVDVDGGGLGSGDARLTTGAGDDGAILDEDFLLGLGSYDFNFIYDGIADGTANGTGGALGLDLSSFDSIDILASSYGGVWAELTLWSSLAQESAMMALAQGLTSFSLAGFGLDLADIQSIQLTIGSLSSSRNVQVFDISAIGSAPATVPEPGTGLLFLSGAAALLGARRRRQRQA